MASSKSKNIDEIDDIEEMFETMKALNISIKGCTTLDQMKDEVKASFDQSAKKPSWTSGQAFSILSKAKDEDARKRQLLLEYYDNTKNLLDRMDEKIRNLLQQEFGDIKEKVKDHKSQLAHKQYFLLVAGETGSGKSSLVNLILGEELLPSSLLSTTSTICELKFGDERKIVAHFKDKDPETGLPTKVIPLKEPPTETTEGSYLQQISPFVHVVNEREKGSIYKKIELFWPHSLLQRGIVIVDSPGIGESEIMDEMVTQYLPEAFAFIYVINSANAGGVQKDRLEKLLEEVRRLSLEAQGQLLSSCALFVCNKWDQVPKKEVKKVTNYVIRNLQRCWPGLDPESQIIYMSSMKASKGQDLGIITDEFSCLMTNMGIMILKSIQARLEIHWRWLHYLLSRIIYQAKAFVKNASRDREKIREEMAQVIDRLWAIETQQDKVKAELKKYLGSRVDVALQKLSNHLSSDQVKDRFTSWTLDEVPKVERSWEATENQIMKALSRRLREIIEQWEEDNQVFVSTRESLLNHFQQRYQYVEVQLRDLQNAVTHENIDQIGSQNTALGEGFSMGEKVAIGVTSLIWFPVGLVALVIGAPFAGVKVIKDLIEDNRKSKKYEANKCAFMSKLSAEYLDTARNEETLRTYVKEQLAEAQLCLKQIQARIPELIQADRMLCEQLRCETRSQREIEEQNQPILNESSELRNRLALFGFEHVLGNEINSEELVWKEDTSHLLGCGSFGAVYEGTMRKNGAIHPVALKVFYEALDTKNASEVMAEVELLRKLNHPHIVKFYGTSLLKTSGETRLILVMKKCKGNLRSRIFDNPECIPGKSGDPTVIQQACRWLIQIIDALAYIHKKGVIHRDLKLANVLLSEDDSVKITDVGASKAAIDITGTIAGTPVYTAPEVVRSEVYNYQADLYSLGIMMWEMWYGQQAFAKVSVPTLYDLFDMVNGGHRPKHAESCKKPPARWETLMKQCWDGDPKQRPNVTKCFEEMTTLSAEF